MLKPQIVSIDVQDMSLKKTLGKMYDSEVSKLLSDITDEVQVKLTLSNSYELANAMRRTMLDEMKTPAISIKNAKVKSNDPNIGMWSLDNIRMIPIKPGAPLKDNLYIKFKSGNRGVDITSGFLKSIAHKNTHWDKSHFICKLQPNSYLEITGLVINQGIGRDHAMYTRIRSPIGYKMLDYCRVHIATETGFISHSRRTVKTADIVKLSKMSANKCLNSRILVIPSDRKKIFDEQNEESLDGYVVVRGDIRVWQSAEITPGEWQLTFKLYDFYKPKEFIKEVLLNIKGRIIKTKNMSKKIKLSTDYWEINIPGEKYTIMNMIKWGIYQECPTIERIIEDTKHFSQIYECSIKVKHPTAIKLFESVCDKWCKYIDVMVKQI
jgi:hypothetical protein